MNVHLHPPNYTTLLSHIHRRKQDIIEFFSDLQDSWNVVVPVHKFIVCYFTSRPLVIRLNCSLPILSNIKSDPVKKFLVVSSIKTNTTQDTIKKLTVVVLYYRFEFFVQKLT